MSDNRGSRPPQDRRPYQSANEIVRSILDDRPPTSNFSPSGELYRAIERFHRNVDRVRRDIPAISGSDQPTAATAMSSGADRDLRRRFNRDPQTSNVLPSISSLTTSANPALPPLRSLGSRRSPSMSTSGGSSGRPGRWRPLPRVSMDALSPSGDEFDRDLERSLGSLDDANTHLRALLDFTTALPVIPPLSVAASPLHSQDRADDHRRVKRRRLESDKMASNFKGFRYGKFGQVEPGQLTMEIVSCDGGIFPNTTYNQHPHHPPVSYVAENILKNDDTVYCTKGNRCNIVLRHQGDTVFSLQELVIKAPPQPHFSSPYVHHVREGMIFVSMDSDELLRRTAQYQIQYSARSTSRNSLAPITGSAATVYSIRHDEDGNQITRITRPRRQFSAQLEDNVDFRTAQIPSEFNVSPSSNITTVCSADEDASPNHDSRAYPRLGSSRPPNRIGSLPFESDNSDDGADAWGGHSADYSWSNFDTLTRGHYSSSRSRDVDHDDGSMTLEQAQEASQIATQEAVRAVGGELMTPLVHFMIEKGKNKCTIRFDPPVSGRFILLKMWTPTINPENRNHANNIDIQAVIAKGFAGPRLFPSVQVR